MRQNGFVFTPDDISNVSIGSILGAYLRLHIHSMRRREGGPHLTYTPRHAEFNIYPGGHAVARSDFKQPCIPYALTGANRVGFWSGWISPQVVSDDVGSLRLRRFRLEKVYSQ